MLSDFAKKKIERMEKEYEKLEETEAKYLAQMESIQNAIARICHEERKRGER